MSFKETETEDILDGVRKFIAENKAGNTASENFTPQFILQFFNQIDISNSVSLNGNKHEFENQINVSNTVTKTEMGTTFRITDLSGNVSSDFPFDIDFCVVN